VFINLRQKFVDHPPKQTYHLTSSKKTLAIIITIIIIYFAQDGIKPSNMTIHEQDRQGYNALTAALW